MTDTASSRAATSTRLDQQVIRLDEHVRALSAQYGELKGEIGKVSAEVETGMRALTADLAARFERMDTRFTSFKDEQAARARPNWVALGSLAVGGFMVTASLVGGAFLLVTMSVRNELSPIIAQIHVGMQDRADMRDAIGDIQTDLRMQVAELRSSIAENGALDKEGRARLSSDLREVETQFCAADSIRELERAQLREEIAAVRREAGLKDAHPNGFSPQVGRCS
jgi:hypothetical protein